MRGLKAEKEKEGKRKGTQQPRLAHEHTEMHRLRTLPRGTLGPMSGSRTVTNLSEG